MSEALEILRLLCRLIPPLAAILHDVLDGDEDARARVRDVLPARHGLHEFIDKNPSKL